MTDLILMLIAAVLPAILLWIYIWKKDTQTEPTKWLVIAILAGVAICIPVCVLEMVEELILFGLDGGPSTLFGTTFNAFFVAALPEETFKLIALWLLLRFNPFFDEHFDGIVYAVCIGLGFAAVENVFYILSSEDWVMVAVMRSLLAVPGHYAFAVLMGYYYSVYHFIDRSTLAAAKIILIPVLFHGIYDALAFAELINPYVGTICFIVLIVFCIKMHLFAKRKIVEQIKKDKQVMIEKK